MNVKCHQAITVRLAVDLKLFDAIAKRSFENEDGKVRVSQLSEDVKADPKLVGIQIPLLSDKFGFSADDIGRIMRALVPLDILKQHTSDIFSPTKFTASYVSSCWMSGAVIFL